MRLIDADALVKVFKGCRLLKEDEIIRIIQNAITEYEWIPVNERLPEDERMTYWVCTNTGYQCECRWTDVNPFWNDLTTDWHWNKLDIPQHSEVLAWMPLPVPYEAG